MKTNKDIQKELEEIGPLFSKMEKENPFQIPHNYFKEMQEEVMGKINTSSTQKAPSRWSIMLGQLNRWFAPRPALVMAGIAAVAIAFFLWTTPETSVSQLASLDAESIEAYIEENIEDFDSDLVMGLAAEEGIGFSSAQQEEEDFIDEILDDMDDNELLNLL